MNSSTRKRAEKSEIREAATEAMQPKPDEELAPGAHQAEELLDYVRLAQSIFWKAVSDLELLLGFEIDSSQDLEDVGIEDLKASKGAPV